MTDVDVINKFIINQREAIYILNKEAGIFRIELEVLAFAGTSHTFSLYDLQKYYRHTNVQQLRRALYKLNGGSFIDIFKKGVKNQPTIFLITKKGKSILSRYSDLLVKNESILSHTTKLSQILVTTPSSKNPLIRY
jgi:hypothetical protein